MKMYVTRGMYISSVAIDTIGSYNEKLSSGWPRFYYKGLRGVAVVRKATTGTVVVTVPDIMPTDKQEEIYDRIIKHKKFNDFIEDIPNELLGVDLLIDSETLERITVDSFMELLPGDLNNQLFILTSEGENGEEIDHWPPYKITNQDSTSLAVMMATFTAPRRCHKPKRGEKWTEPGKMLLIMMCSKYYELPLNYASFSSDQLAKRQNFYIPVKDRARMKLPSGALKEIDGLTREIHADIVKKAEKAEQEAKKKEAEKEAKDKKEEETGDVISSKPKLLPSGKKALFLSDLLQIGIDTYLKGMEDHVAETVEIDMQLEASLHIKNICLFGGALIIDTGGETFDEQAVKDMFGTENVYIAEME